jgi:hypothetical protein
VRPQEKDDEGQLGPSSPTRRPRRSARPSRGRWTTFLLVPYYS